jgi:hypothetical protein
VHRRGRHPGRAWKNDEVQTHLIYQSPEVFRKVKRGHGVRKAVFLVAICCVGVGVYFGFIHNPSARRSGRGTRIIPGIEFAFTRDENAADYYAKACDSLSRRSQGNRMPESLTRQEREWFVLGTSCRRSSWYPEHAPHIVGAGYAGPQLQYARGLGRIMAGEGRSAEKSGDVKKAMDIWRRVAVLGWHTEREEECVLQVLVGIAIESVAYKEFARYYRERGDTERARRFEDFDQLLHDRTQEFKKLSNLKSAEDYSRIKGYVLSHKSTLWRKEACMSLAYYCGSVDKSVREDAAATLRAVSGQDRESVVRETARNMIPYALGQKALPQ